MREKEKKPVTESSVTGLKSVHDMIRTRDLLIRSQTLYPAELHAHICIFLNKNLFFVKEKFIKRNG